MFTGHDEMTKYKSSKETLDNELKVFEGREKYC